VEAAISRKKFTCTPKNLSPVRGELFDTMGRDDRLFLRISTMRVTVPPTKIFLASVFFLVALNVSATGLVALAAPRKGPEAVDFERDIWPILSDHCIRCHGPDAQEGQLRLDGRTAAHRGGVSGALFAKEISESLLMERLTSGDPDERMPLDSPALEKSQIESLAAWIEAGHPWPEHIGANTAAKEDHWAYEKPSLPTFPSTRRAMGAGNPIDLFVRKRLAEEGLQSARPADPATLIRRLYLLQWWGQPDEIEIKPTD